MGGEGRAGKTVSNLWAPLFEVRKRRRRNCSLSGCGSDQECVCVCRSTEAFSKKKEAEHENKTQERESKSEGKETPVFENRGGHEQQGGSPPFVRRQKRESLRTDTPFLQRAS